MFKPILYIQPTTSTGGLQEQYKKVDFYKDEKISLNFTIQDIRDIEKVFTDFSKSFTLPASKSNNAIFNYWWNPDIEGYNANYKAPATIELGNLPFRKGVLKLNKVKMVDNKPAFYDVTFFGETIDLKNVIGEDYLSDLNWLDNFEYNNTNWNAKLSIQQGLNLWADNQQYNRAIVSPAIGVQTKFIYDSSNPPNSWSNLYRRSANQSSGMFPADIKPGIKVDIILKAIEKRYTKANGYERDLKFSDDVFYSEVTEELYLWLHRNRGALEGGGSLSFNTTTYSFDYVTGSGSPNDIIAEGYFNQSYIPVGGSCYPTQGNQVYFYGNEIGILFQTYPQPTAYREGSITANIIPASGFETVDYNIELVSSFNGQVKAVVQGVQGNNSLTYSFNTNDQGAGYTDSIYLRVSSDSNFNFGVKYDLYFNGMQSYNTDYGLGPEFCYDIGQGVNVSGSFQSVSDTIPLLVTVTPTKQVPKIKVLDFLTGLFKLFNLTAYFEEGIIRVRTLDEFYSDYETYDLTNYILSDKHTVGSALPFTDIEFKYKKPNDVLTTKFFELNNRYYGETEFVADASKGRRYEVKVPFTNMLYERLPDYGAGGLTKIQIGSAIDDKLDPVLTPPILFYANQVNDGEVINWIDTIRPDDGSQPNPNTATSLTAYNVPSTTYELGTSSVAPLYNINFNNEINTYNLTNYSGQDNNLFSKYYFNYIRKIFNIQNRLYSFEAMLPLSFLLKFKLSDRVIISNREFKINKIKADITTGKATLELINEFRL